MYNLPDNAHKFTKNPLGIIALFILLIYGIAGGVLGMSGSELSEYQKSVLIWFFAIFPFAVLFSFVWLVSRHHSKLYSPSDFRDDEGFLKAQNTEVQKDRLEKKANDFITEKEEKIISENKDNETITLSSAKEEVLIIDNLAIREIENIYNVPVTSNVSLSDNSGVDGIFLKDEIAHIVEIKYYRGRINIRSIHHQLLKLIDRLESLNWEKFKIVFVVVTEDEIMPNSNYFKKQSIELTHDLGVKIIFIPLGINELKSKYGIKDS